MLLRHLIEKFTSEDAYKSLFKAAITLFVFYFVAVYQVSNTLLPIEKEAYQLKFSYEYSEGKKFIDFKGLNMSECKVEKENYKECAMSVHLNETSESSINAVVAVQKLLKLLAFSLLGMSFLSFMGHPYIHKLRKSNEPIRKA